MLIGVLTAITLLLLLVFVVILLLSRRQKLQSSPTVLKNPFEFAINMKVDTSVNERVIIKKISHSTRSNFQHLRKLVLNIT